MKKHIFTCILIAATIFTLSFSYLLKKPCVDTSWHNGSQYYNLCYNDIQPLYYSRNLHEKFVPYVKEKSYEYPVVTGLFMWVSSLFAKNSTDYFKISAWGLALAGLLSTHALINALGPRRSILWFAAGTPLLFYAFLNWDLIVVCSVCMAMWAWRRGSLLWTGVSLGIGVSAKIYPLFLIPSLIIYLCKKPHAETQKIHLKNILTFVGAIFLTGVLVNAPFVLAEYGYSGNISGWLHVFKVHIDRVADYGTLWYWLKYFNSDPSPDVLRYLLPMLIGGLTFWLMGVKTRYRKMPLLAIGTSLTAALIYFSLSSKASDDFIKFLSEAFFFVGVVALLLNQLVRNKSPWSTAAAILALYLMVSKIYSPQHTLWMIPLMVAVNVRPSILLGFLLSDILCFCANDFWMASVGVKQFNGWTELYILGICLRTFFLGKFALHCAFTGKDRFRLGGWERKIKQSVSGSDARNTLTGSRTSYVQCI